MGAYITISDINAYPKIPYAKALWDALTDPDKDAWIDVAESHIDKVPEGIWLGVPSDPASNRSFPRKLLVYAQATLKWVTIAESIQAAIERDDGIVPESIKSALCETIMEGIQTATLDRLSNMPGKGIESLEIGSLSLKFMQYAWNMPLPPKPWGMVYYLTTYFWFTRGKNIVRY